MSPTEAHWTEAFRGLTHIARDEGPSEDLAGVVASLGPSCLLVVSQIDLVQVADRISTLNEIVTQNALVAMPEDEQ